MKKYTVSNLNAKTPQDEQTKLLSAIKGVKGVASAQLYPGSSEFGLTAREKESPKQEDLASAVSKAGFSLSKADKK